MRARIDRRRVLAAGAAAGAGLAFGPARAADEEHRPDLADAVAGFYPGDVISDSRGASKAGVALTLMRVGPNRVGIASDYERLPTLEVTVERAMDKIVNAGGDTAFVYDPATRKLDVSFNNEVSWSGVRTAH